MLSKEKNPRLLALDYLRGFFIIVIIIDHLGRWPNMLGVFSGRALLWVTAAEGFVIISGLLVGYVRGAKNRQVPFRDITKKLLLRAALLYAWSIIASLAYLAIIWNVQLKGGTPSTDIEIGNWSHLLSELVTLNYTFVWVHFLTLYAIFLAVSPLAVWLIRQGKTWLIPIVSLVLLVVGWETHVEALQWQALFFIPSALGVYIEPIQSSWGRLSVRRRNLISLAIIMATILTIILSTLCIFYSDKIQYFADIANGMFAKDTISIWRLGLAFLWFTGYLLVFTRLQNVIGKYFGWLLIPFGTRSLTAYILHGLVIVGVSYYTVSSESILVNTTLGIFSILAVWILIKNRSVKTLLPR